MVLRIADDDGPKFLLIARAEECRIEGHSARQLGDVLAIDRAVACELGQRQVVGIEREQPQAWKSAREQLGETFRVRLRKAGHANVLEMETILPRQSGFWAGDLLQCPGDLRRNDLDVVDVVRWTRQIVVERGDEAPETVNVDRPR